MKRRAINLSDWPKLFVLAGIWGASSVPTISAPSDAGNARGSNAESSNHLAMLIAKAPPGFTCLWEPPFFIIGDEPVEMVRRRATNTVKWAVDLLKRDYFTRDPLPTIDIWLFKDKDSYEKNVRELFQDTPTSRFGYYSPAHRALFMNISTGGGTLVHEIVHPFMETNFPNCPAWLNEGLASLFEASTVRDGHLKGLINWRLTGLEAAIRQQTLLPFDKLMALSHSEFYENSGDANAGEHYAQARYLCYYLQEKGLLRPFYREFSANVKTDPTGVRSLKKVLQENDLEAFKNKWEKFILQLRTP